MPIKLKPLSQQVIVITGATSGIGLATVRKAVEQGAKVFMIARDEEQLQALQDEMRGMGYHTAYAVADVAEIDQVQVAADQCVATFGGIDSWVNNAGISIYSKVLETTEEEAKRLFDTNFWGVMNGCKVAVPYLSINGGSLINIGSVLSQVALPIQGIYSASKFAVKGFTDALRRELKSENTPISVSLVMPGAIDTPFTQHARSHIGEPVHVAPVYAAEVVAETILKCAVRPIREIGVGSSSFIFPLMERWFPRVQDRITSLLFSEKNQSKAVDTNYREDGGTGNLFSHHEQDGKVEGNYPGHVMKSSIMTNLASSKKILSGTFVAAGMAFVFLKRLKIV